MDSAIWAVAPDHTLIATVSHGCLRLLHPHVSVRRVATTLITLNALDSAVTHLAILPSSRTVVAGTATGVVAAWAPDGCVASPSLAPILLLSLAHGTP